ncbi:MAG TPA: YoaK family protein [Solirubrobacterales bacterium]
MDASTESDPTKWSPRAATTTSLRLALLLATIAGFLDAYSYLERGGVFANAQSANVVLFGVRASAGAWGQALHYLPPIGAFAVGIAIGEALQRWPERIALRRPARAAITVELAILLAVGFVPQHYPDVIAVCALSFAAALQSVMFADLRGRSYSSILATINLRTMILAGFAALADRDRVLVAEAAEFGLLVVAFGLGAALGGLLGLHLHGRAIWVAAALLGLAFALYSLDRRQTPAETRGVAGDG